MGNMYENISMLDGEHGLENFLFTFSFKSFSFLSDYQS
jgi:hypothetical protein